MLNTREEIESKLAKMLQKEFPTDIDRLKFWVGIQRGDEIEEVDDISFEMICDLILSKIVWDYGDFGSNVKVIFAKHDIETKYEPEIFAPEDYGYLTCLPGYEDSADMVGIVHIAHIQGEKCDAGPV